MIQRIQTALALGLMLVAQAAYGQADVTFSDVKNVTSVVSSVTTTTRMIDEGGDSIGDPKTDVVSADPVVTTVDAGKLLAVTTEAANVQLRVSNLNRDPVDFQDLGEHRYLLSTAGKQWIDLQVVDFAKNIFFSRQYVVEVKSPVIPDPPQPTPTPVPPQPDPPPTPTPGVAPIEGPGFRVMFVAETGDDMPAAVADIFYSPEITAYLNANCIKVDGHPDFRRVDPDTQYTDQTNRFVKALARPRASLPWLIISNGVTGYEGPFPATVAETLALLKRLNTSQAALTPAVVTVHTTDGCAACELFIREEAPKLGDMKIEVVHGGAYQYPTFSISIGGKSRTFSGFVTAATLRQRILELSQ